LGWATKVGRDEGRRRKRRKETRMEERTRTDEMTTGEKEGERYIVEEHFDPPMPSQV